MRAPGISRQMTIKDKLLTLAQDIRRTPARARALSDMNISSGLVWELSLRGVQTAAKNLLTGGTNPAMIYRIHGQNTPQKPAIIYRDGVTTFAELDSLVDRLAHGLTRRGVRKGTSFLLLMKNKVEFVALAIAATRIGASAVSASWRATPAELAYLVENSRARAIIFDHELASTVEMAELGAISTSLARFSVGGRVKGADLLSELVDAAPSGKYAPEKGADDDAAVVIYTSGTTGKPKGAVRKFPKDAFTQACTFISSTPMRADDVHLVTCPLYHSTAFGFLSLSHLLGCTAVIMDEYKPQAFMDACEKYRVSTVAIVPTMLQRLLDAGPEVLRSRETRSLRAVFSGGAPLSGQLAAAFMDEFGDVLYNFYGATETGLVTLATPRDLRDAPGTIGRTLPGNHIKLLDESGRETNGTGELYVKNDLLVAGYYGDETATSDSMKDGFFSVGDLARKDRDGRFFIEGRKRDMIISGGVNVYPAEVEGALEAHPDVLEVAVVGVPDREWGEKVRAFVVPRQGVTLDEATIKLYAKARLSGAKVPRDFVFLDALPRNPTGKVLKRELRDR
jgi:fatty-acyl-CoA synthase